jgi:hypothetical protein
MPRVKVGFSRAKSQNWRTRDARDAGACSCVQSRIHTNMRLHRVRLVYGTERLGFHLNLGGPLLPVHISVALALLLSPLLSLSTASSHALPLPNAALFQPSAS